jgi:hypothetical protein
MTALDRVKAGEVVCQIGQVSQEERRALDRATRSGEIVKWRGYWHPVAGASWGIGPLKTCWARPNVRARIN